MTHVLGRLAVQALLAVAPLLTLPWSIVDRYGYQRIDGTDQIYTSVLGLPLVGTKPQVELQLRVVVIAIALIVSAGLDMVTLIVDVYQPRRRLQDFRGDFLEGEKKKNWDELLGRDVRVNVMFARRPWHFPFLRRLQWTWSTGYEPPARHHDANIAFWEFQGVCGRALRRATPVFADLREAPLAEQSHYWRNDFRLGPKQFKKTQNVKAILSVPLYARKGGEAPSWKPVGVINLDTIDAAAADLLAAKADELQGYFVRLGMSIARLWV